MRESRIYKRISHKSQRKTVELVYCCFQVGVTIPDNVYDRERSRGGAVTEVGCKAEFVLQNPPTIAEC